MNIYYIYQLLKSLNNNPNSPELIQKILDQCSPLLKNITKQYKNYCWKEDIDQVARIGLFKAIKKYDLSYHSCFINFALIYTKGEIKHFLRDSTKLIREPDQKTLLLLKAHKYIEKHLIEQHLFPSIESLIHHLECTDKLAYEALSKYKLPFMMLSPLNTKYLDFNEPQYLEKIYVENILKFLSPQEQYLLKDFYTMGLTQTQIAKKNNISQAQVSILLKKISLKVRKHVA